MRAGLFTSSEDMKLPKMFLSGLSKERMAAEGSRAVKESLDGLKISAPDSAALAEARRERCGRSRMGLTPRDEELEREGADIELVCVFVQITNEKITTDFVLFTPPYSVVCRRRAWVLHANVVERRRFLADGDRTALRRTLPSTRVQAQDELRGAGIVAYLPPRHCRVCTPLQPHHR